MAVKEDRLHGLDVLRGVAMILGIFLHGAITYKAGYPYGELIHDPDAEYYFFDWMHLAINSFRMQLFFLLAGFFACLVVSRKGFKFFINNRFKRIVIPLVLGYLTILPATLVPVVYYQNMTQNPWAHVADFLASFFTFQQFSGLIHLWFLYDLIIFYVVALALKSLIDKFNSIATFANSIGDRINGFGLITACIIIIGLISQLYVTPVLTIWTGLRPPLPQLLYYGFFFCTGWYLQVNRQLMVQVGGFYMYFLWCGFLLSLINFYVLNFYFTEGSISHLYDTTFRFSLSVQTIFGVFGLLGLFNARFQTPTATGMYMAKSAYWVYLIHNPIVLTIQLLLLDSFVPGVLKFPFVVIITAIISYLSYHYLVRRTWIGALLNGK